MSRTNRQWHWNLHTMAVNVFSSLNSYYYLTPTALCLLWYPSYKLMFIFPPIPTRSVVWLLCTSTDTSSRRVKRSRQATSTKSRREKRAEIAHPGALDIQLMTQLHPQGKTSDGKNALQHTRGEKKTLEGIKCQLHDPSFGWRPLILCRTMVKVESMNIWESLKLSFRRYSALRSSKWVIIKISRVGFAGK